MKYENCALVMTDVVGYSRMPQNEQATSIKTLLEIWFNTNPKLPTSANLPECALLPTGDGFIGVMPLSNEGGVPLWLLEFVVAAIDAASRAIPPFQLRFGLHCGPCLLVQITNTSVDFSREPNNYLGYNMNYVARLANCAGAGQIIASDDFITSLGNSLNTNHLFQVRRDEFRVAFKGDFIRFTLTGDIELDAGMKQAQSLAEDKRGVHSIVLCKDGNSWGKASVPNNSVHYKGKNNYHHLSQKDRTIFQRLPDVELFSLYRKEPRIAAITNQPFFVRLPFTVLYASGDDGPLNVSSQTTQSVDWQIDENWVRESFDSFDNGDLCSLSSLEIEEKKLTASLSYTHCTYAQSLATVISPDRCINGNLGESLRRLLLQESLAKSRPHLLPALGGKLLTAHIGVTAIVLTSDGRPIIQPRCSKGLHSNIDSQSASVSGAVDWSDWIDLHSSLKIPLQNSKELDVSYEGLVKILRPCSKSGDLMPSDRAILREAGQEIALFPNVIKSIQLVGIAREFRRIGKPEFFYLLISALNRLQYGI